MPIRVLVVADMRSTIARGWVSAISGDPGLEVTTLSTFPVDDGRSLLSPWGTLTVGGASKGWASESAGRASLAQRVRASPMARALITRSRQPSVALDVALNRRRFAAIERDVRPDVIAALRIPFEGIITTRMRPAAPVVLSVWGNDFTLMAEDDRWTMRATAAALGGASGLMTDCQRDIDIAPRYGWRGQGPTAVMAGAGGIDAEEFHPGPADPAFLHALGVPDGAPLVVNVRGYRPYVLTETFLEASAHLLARHPEAVVVATGLKNEPGSEAFLQRRGLTGRIILTDVLSRPDLARLLRGARVVVSPTNHDGTPNSLLEAMASGCLPVVGDIPSIREWIAHGRNGLLWDVGSGPVPLAAEMARALVDDDLHTAAAAENAALVATRADKRTLQREAAAFYAGIAGR